jgi:beta-phosphoglucomutase-like phosphatase (HAD superfamily)
VKKRGFRRAAVTNAPRPNAEQMIAAVGLTDFFEYLVIGNECERPKPFPDPYLKALKHFKVSAENAFAFEVRSITLKFSFLFLSTRRH